jgi:hypothetical protein
MLVGIRLKQDDSTPDVIAVRLRQADAERLQASPDRVRSLGFIGSFLQDYSAAQVRMFA